MSEVDRNIAELERQYQANVSSAIADNDYQRAQALLNEYNNGYTRDLNTAKTLAAYGISAATPVCTDRTRQTIWRPCGRPRTRTWPITPGG